MSAIASEVQMPGVAHAFRFTDKQVEALTALSGAQMHTMLFGGSRSGKTFLHVRNVIMRALKAPGSRHLIARFRFNHLKASIILDTFPRVMRICFPAVKFDISKSDWFATLPGGSEIWFAGLDDKDRTEKILGLEFATVFLNECSQISWTSVQMILTRLAQKVAQFWEGVADGWLQLRAFYDCNPPSKAHWTFRLFKQHVDPETKENMRSPADYVSVQMNPRDNAENLSPEYFKTFDTMSERMRRRFERGEFADATPGALFDEAIIDRWRVTDGNLPAFVRVVVAQDPSGADDEDNADNDEIGGAVVALGTDGVAYVLEDVTVKAGPATWGAVGVTAYARHKADALVAETNFGGAMVKAVVQAAAAKEGIRVNFKMVTASRGKIARAEPFSALYENGKVRHVGILAKAEDELCAMSTYGYTGQGSPNRADSIIWALAELFPAIVAPPRKERPTRERGERGGRGAWMK